MLLANSKLDENRRSNGQILVVFDRERPISVVLGTTKQFAHNIPGEPHSSRRVSRTVPSAGTHRPKTMKVVYGITSCDLQEADAKRILQ